jgi:hypothetical protein
VVVPSGVTAVEPDAPKLPASEMVTFVAPGAFQARVVDLPLCMVDLPTIMVGAAHGLTVTAATELAGVVPEAPVAVRV